VIEAQGTSAGTSRAVAEGDLKLPGLEKSVKELIEERKEARKRKDFKEADRIRKELDDHGVVLEDKGSETNWRMK
jgi:cysteinyl-tRNA synthetase